MKSIWHKILPAGDHILTISLLCSTNIIRIYVGIYSNLLIVINMLHLSSDNFNSKLKCVQLTQNQNQSVKS